MNPIQRFYVGTYTEPILFGTGEILRGKGEGIYILELDRQEKCLRSAGLAAETRNPSYLTISSEKNCVYAVNELKERDEGPGGSISVFQICRSTGKLTCIQTLQTHGQDPCHVALAPSEKWLAVANFTSGSVCVYEADRDGVLREAGFAAHRGSGPNPKRQKGPHAHSCIWLRGEDRFWIPDLGIDRLEAYRMTENGELEQWDEASCSCRPGSGPRYGEFHPAFPVLYVIHELTSSVSVLEWDRQKGKLKCIQEISTLPYACDNICADLHVTGDGRFVYVSNRGHDSITGYRVLDDGRLERLFTVSSGGKTPRNFVLDQENRFLLVGNQDSDNVVLMERHPETGELTERSRIFMPTPVCICPSGM